MDILFHTEEYVFSYQGAAFYLQRVSKKWELIDFV